MPGATHDEIKHAYVDLAKRFHPDRQVDQSPSARQDAERRMREVTQAWAVLRNPARRQAYDASLRGDRPVWERQTATPRPPRTSTVTPGAARGPGPPGFEVPAAHSPFLRFGPMVLVALVLIGILIFTAYANQRENGSPEVDPNLRPESAIPFEVGDCVVLASAGGRVLPIEMACTAAGAQEVRALTDLGRPCPAGSESFDLIDEQLRLCLQP
jgi:hypothetical protein